MAIFCVPCNSLFFYYHNFIVRQAHIVIFAATVALYSSGLAVHATAGYFFCDLKAFH